MTARYIELVKTDREVEASVEIDLVKTVKVGEIPFRERRYGVEEYVIIREEGENETLAIVGVNIERKSVQYEDGKQLYIIGGPYLNANFKIRRVKYNNENNKAIEIKYIMYPLSLSVTDNEGKLKLATSIPPDIESPEEIYRSLEEIIACVEKNNGRLKCVHDLDDKVRMYVIAPIEKSGSCKPGSYCGELVGAYWEMKNL